MRAKAGRPRVSAAVLYKTLSTPWLLKNCYSAICVMSVAAKQHRVTAMPMHLEGSCRCGAVVFDLDSHTPVPYQLCYCTICRKTAGGGGFAINLGGQSKSLNIRKGKRSIGVYRAEICDDDGSNCEISTGERNFCKHCGTALWLYDPTWPELIHPFASVIDTDLPVPTSKVHLMLRYRANWVKPQVGRNDERYELYPKLSLADWHRKHKQWVK